MVIEFLMKLCVMGLECLQKTFAVPKLGEMGQK